MKTNMKKRIRMQMRMRIRMKMRMRMRMGGKMIKVIENQTSFYSNEECKELSLPLMDITLKL
jgi:hypothetical protein